MTLRVFLSTVVESARAMLASHRYVTPHYLGQPFFDKPILSYWAIVASFETLGLTHFAARLPSLLRKARLLFDHDWISAKVI